MAEELKPCPFCGHGVTLVYNGHAGRSPTGQEWWIDCRNDACLYDNGVYSYYSAAAVMRAWASRPIEDALSAENTALRAKWESVPWDALHHLAAYPWANQPIPESERSKWAEVFDWLRYNAPPMK